MRRLWATLAVCAAMLAGLLVVNAASADSVTRPAATEPTVTIKNFTYTGDLTVHPGQHVLFKNADPFSHTATNPAGKFNTGTIPAGKGRQIIAPKTVGNYAIRCNFHATMKGTLHVVKP